MIEYKQINTTTFALTSEGEGLAANGSHEYRLWSALDIKGGKALTVQEIEVGFLYTDKASPPVLPLSNRQAGGVFMGTLIWSVWELRCRVSWARIPRNWDRVER